MTGRNQPRSDRSRPIGLPAIGGRYSKTPYRVDNCAYGAHRFIPASRPVVGRGYAGNEMAGG